MSVQATILRLLADLKRDLGMSYLFVSHDLKVVEHMTAARGHEVAVMYLGRIVERAPASKLFARPRHPYTEALLSAVPDPRPGRKKLRVLLEGDVPSPIDPPSGCAFHPRCPLAKRLDASKRARCSTEIPFLRPLDGAQLAACHFSEEL